MDHSRTPGYNLITREILTTMTKQIFAETLEQRRALAATVLRIKPEDLNSDELDLAMALLREETLMVENGVPHIEKEDYWEVFSPVTDWGAYGEVVSSNGFVVASHERYDDPADAEKVTGYWYSAHAYVGGTNAEGYDLREVVGEAAARLLAHNVAFKASWQLPEADSDSNR